PTPSPEPKSETTPVKPSESPQLSDNATPKSTPQAKPAASPAVASGSTPTDDSKAASKPHRFGFDKLKYVPSLTLAIKSQPAQFDFPESSRPKERATFTDGTLQLSLRSELARGHFGSQTQFDFAGSTFQQEALRFGTLGNR